MAVLGGLGGLGGLKILLSLFFGPSKVPYGNHKYFFIFIFYFLKFFLIFLKKIDF